MNILTLRHAARASDAKLNIKLNEMILLKKIDYL